MGIALCFLDVHSVYQSILFILSIGLIIDSLEDISNWSVFTASGLLSWRVSRLAVRSRFRWALDKVLRETVFKYWVYLKLLFSVCIFVGCLFGYISSLLLFLEFLLLASISLRSGYGLDGAYQMNIVVLLASTIGTVKIGSFVSIVCLYFIVAQLLLSYTIYEN